MRIASNIEYCYGQFAEKVYIKNNFSIVDVRAKMTLLHSQFFKIQRKQLEVAEV